MSKQYLTAHTVGDNATPIDIFSVAVTRHHLLTASGASSISVYSTTAESFPRAQSLTKAHPLGTHHVTVSTDGRFAASVGFGSQVSLWRLSGDDGDDAAASAKWESAGTVTDGVNPKACEVWAVALSDDGRFLAGTTADGRCLVWDVRGGPAAEGDPGPEMASRPTTRPPSDLSTAVKICEFETSNSKGSFGLCVDMSPDGALTATGHVSGSVYLFANATGRLAHALPSLNAPVRSVKFSPAGKLLAAAGDSCTIALHDARSPTPLAHLRGHTSWVLSLAFSPTGERLASTDWSGRVKVWDVGRRECVWTGRVDGGGPLWSVAWVRETRAGVFGALGRCEGFVVGGAKGLVRVFREAAGG